MDLRATIWLEKRWIKESIVRYEKFKKDGSKESASFELLIQMKANKRIHDLNEQLINLGFKPVNYGTCSSRDGSES